MTGTPQSPTPRRKRLVPIWVKVLLAVSLALNFAIAGFVGGSVMRVQREAREEGPGAGFAFIKALDREDRRETLRSMRDVSRVARRESRQEMAQILEILRAEPLDEDKLRLLLNDQVARVGQVQLRISSRVFELVVQMGPEARMAYADRVEEVLKRGSRPKGQPGPGN